MLGTQKIIHLVGPGGAGKTTTGIALAERLKVQFMDLDAEFIAKNGDISKFIDMWGYEAYAAQNVNSYLALLSNPNSLGVIALSSGFMTYHEGIHPEYPVMRQRIASSELTFVLLPSLDLEACVSEVVRRQLQRPCARTPQREDSVIRSRFSIYANLVSRKVITQQSISAVVDEILALLPNNSLQPTVKKAALFAVG